ncbi:MATE family efflux transporter [candidate division KSB1 bacterium]|nr:MATE family efflux transporter [candidate division KSB1 bacterium]
MTIGLKQTQTFFKRQDIRSFISRSWAISWPMTLIMFFEFLISLADVYIAGKISKEVQAAYGFVTQIYFIFTVIGNALTIGTVSVISRLCQDVEEQSYSRAVFSTVVSTTLAGFLLGVAGIFLTPMIFSFLNIPEVLKELGRPLAAIYAGGLIFHYILINTNGILRACKGIRKSLRTMAVVCVTNVGLNFFFVFYTPLGFKGIALSTAVSVGIGSLWNLWLIKDFLIQTKKVAFDVIKKVTSIGWPSGLLQIIWQTASMILFLILSALPENNIEIVAAFTNGLRIEAAIFLPAFAFNMSNAVVVGNLLGEKKSNDAYQAGIITAAIGVVVVSILTIIMLFNARIIASTLSQNGIVINETVKYLSICLISEPIMAWGVILSGGLNGAGDTKSVMIRVALSVWLVRIPLCYIFGVLLEFGAVAVWWSMNASLLVQAILISRRYFRKKWLIGS